MAGLAAAGERGLLALIPAWLPVINASHAGMMTDEFAAIVTELEADFLRCAMTFQAVAMLLSETYFPTATTARP